jgi:hypothetical protein
MHSLSRRQFVALGLVSAAARSARGGSDADAPLVDIHQQLLGLAARQEAARRARFAAVKTKADLEVLRKELRQTLLRLLGGFPDREGIPPARTTGTIGAGDYLVEKLVFESLPGYFIFVS